MSNHKSQSLYLSVPSQESGRPTDRRRTPPAGSEATALGLWQDDSVFEKPRTHLEPQTDPQSVPNAFSPFAAQTQEATACSNCTPAGGAHTVQPDLVAGFYE